MYGTALFFIFNVIMCYLTFLENSISCCDLDDKIDTTQANVT